MGEVVICQPKAIESCLVVIELQVEVYLSPDNLVG